MFVSEVLLLKKEESYTKVFERFGHIVLLAYLWLVIYGEFRNLHFRHSSSFNNFFSSLKTFYSYKEGSGHLWYLYCKSTLGIYLIPPIVLSGLAFVPWWQDDCAAKITTSLIRILAFPIIVFFICSAVTPITKRIPMVKALVS